MFKGLRLLVAASAVASTVAFNPGVAFAGCIPTRPDDGLTYFAGWNSYGEPATTTVDTANIFNYASPYVYPGSGAFAWVMLNGPVSNDYAQIGWVVDSNGNRHTFTEWNASGQVGSNFTIIAAAAGSTSWYEVYLSGGTDYCFALGGANVGCSGNLGWTGNYGEDNAEIHTLADQMPGSYTVPEDWNNSFIFYNGAQHNFNGYGVDSNTKYFNDAIYSQIHAQAGDKACYS